MAFLKNSTLNKIRTVIGKVTDEFFKPADTDLTGITLYKHGLSLDPLGESRNTVSSYTIQGYVVYKKDVTTPANNRGVEVKGDCYILINWKDLATLDLVTVGGNPVIDIQEMSDWIEADNKEFEIDEVVPLGFLKDRYELIRLNCSYKKAQNKT